MGAGVGVGEGATVGDGVGEGVAVGAGVGVGEGVTVGDGVGEGVGFGTMRIVPKACRLAFGFGSEFLTNSNSIEKASAEGFFAVPKGRRAANIVRINTDITKIFFDLEINSCKLSRKSYDTYNLISYMHHKSTIIPVEQKYYKKLPIPKHNKPFAIIHSIKSQRIIISI